MKYLLIIMLPVVMVGCNSESNLTPVDDFVENFIVGESAPNYENLEHYVEIEDSKSEQIKEMIKLYVEDYRNELRSVKNYEIITDRELSNKHSFENNIVYEPRENIRYLVVDGKVKMFFIVNEGKIISFFANHQKHAKNELYPVILSE